MPPENVRKPGNIRKAKGFLMFSRGIEMKQHDMGKGGFLYIFVTSQIGIKMTVKPSFLFSNNNL